MSALYLYSITRRMDDAHLGETGFEGASLFSITHRDISAVVSRVSVSNPDATPGNLCLHERVIEYLMSEWDVLPVRFGTVASNEEAVQALLQHHYGSFQSNLNRVRGRVELGLRVLWNEERRPDIPPSEERVLPSSARTDPIATPAGRAYLISRLEEQRRAEASGKRADILAAGIHSPLAEQAVESVQRVLLTPRMLLSAAYLLDRKRIDPFLAKLADLTTSYADLQFLCTGPWPPYNFVTGCIPRVEQAHRTAFEVMPGEAASTQS